MSKEFTEADRRLARMHGYDVPVAVAEQLDRLEAKVETLETLVRVLTRALEAGAIGRWRDLGPRP